MKKIIILDFEESVSLYDENGDEINNDFFGTNSAGEVSELGYMLNGLKNIEEIIYIEEQYLPITEIDNLGEYNFDWTEEEEEEEYYKKYDKVIKDFILKYLKDRGK